MTARELLGPDVLRALKWYKDNCKNQFTVPWDKMKDWKNIVKHAKKRRYYAGIESCGGTFWFHFYTPKNRKTVRVHDLRRIKLLGKNSSMFD